MNFRTSPKCHQRSLSLLFSKIQLMPQSKSRALGKPLRVKLVNTLMSSGSKLWNGRKKGEKEKVSKAREREKERKDDQCDVPQSTVTEELQLVMSSMELHWKLAHVLNCTKVIIHHPQTLSVCGCTQQPDVSGVWRE